MRTTATPPATRQEIVGTAPPWRRAVLRVAVTRAWTWLPVPCPVGVLVGPDGTTLRVDDLGRVAEILAPGHPSRGGAASDPVNCNHHP